MKRKACQHTDHVGYRSPLDNLFLHSNALYGDGTDTYFWSCDECIDRDFESEKNPLNKKGREV